MKIVINRCYGGFGLSEAAYKEMGIEWDGYGHGSNLERTDPKLIACVEKLGKAADGKYSELKVVDVPDDIKWVIEDYDGIETVREVSRSWF